MTNYNHSKTTYLKFSIWPLKINCENPVYKRRIQMLEFLFTSIPTSLWGCCWKPVYFQVNYGFYVCKSSSRNWFPNLFTFDYGTEGRHKIHVYCPSFQRWFSIFASVAFCIRLGLFADLLMMLNWLPKLARNTLGD